MLEAAWEIRCLTGFMAPMSEETFFITFSITRNSLGLYEEIEKRQLHQITGGDNKIKVLYSILYAL